MRELMMCVVSACVLVAGVPGCKPKQSKEERQAAAAEALRLEVEAQFAAIGELRTKEQTDEAMALLDKCLANKKFTAYRPGFFTQKVDILLAQDKIEEVSGLILKTWEKEPQLAQSVFERIYAYHQTQGDNPAVIAWCKQLLGMGKGETLPKYLRPKVLEWQLSAALALDDTAVILETVDQMVANLEPKAVASRLQKVVGAMINAGKFEQVSELVAHLASHKDCAAQEYKDLVASSNLQSVIAQKEWQKVPGAFEVCVAQLKDDFLLSQLRLVEATFKKNQQLPLLEKISQSVFLTAPSKLVSASYAAKIWLEIGVAADKNVLPERLVALLDAGVTPDHVALLFDTYFYILAEDQDALKKLYAIGERIIRECHDKAMANDLKIRLVDGAFMMEQYDLALSVLESGIPSQPQVWHDMYNAKVKAHRALAQDKPLEAIVHFRAFMKALTDSDTEETIDPTTGVCYSREWILGLNAHRIASLYDTASDTTNAAKAREEAKTLFNAALKKAEQDETTLNVLKAELKKMGL